jgi:hypothetical protein
VIERVFPGYGEGVGFWPAYASIPPHVWEREVRWWCDDGALLRWGDEYGAFVIACSWVACVVQYNVPLAGAPSDEDNGDAWCGCGCSDDDVI